MDTKYYYFVASLPMVTFEGRPPFSVEDFLRDSKRLLQEDDHRLLELLLTQDNLPKNNHNPIFDRWSKFSQDFKNEQAWLRAQAAGKDPLNYIRGERSPDLSFSDILQQAQKADNPLEGQKVLDRFLWKFLDELEFGQTFGFGFILIYGLKLKILERYARINSPVGEKMFEELEETEIPLSFTHQI